MSSIAVAIFVAILSGVEKMSGRNRAMSAVSFEPLAIPMQMTDDGVIRVSGTRVTIDPLVACFHEGATPEEMAQQYPVVPLADIYAVIAFYLRKREQVDAYLAQREQQ